MSEPITGMREALIETVEHAGPYRDLAPGFRNREVVKAGDLRRTSPFVVLVEDRVAGLDGDHMHPHRGFETVTFVLEGEITNVDHTGYSSVTPAGAVQWMTAGSGIMHGGRPHGDATCHMLQLWLNLPAVLRASRPGSREQRREQAVPRVAPGARAWIYGRDSQRQGEAAWSLHPLALTDLHLDADATFVLDVAPGDRMLLYVVSGSVEAGDRHLAAGDAGWVAPDRDARALRLHSADGARVVAYASQPIDEPSVAKGPFVMTNEAEIRQAYADLRAGRLVR